MVSHGADNMDTTSILYLFLINGRLNLSHIFEDPVFLMLLIFLFLKSRVRTVQRGSLHGCFLSDFTFWPICRVLEGATNFTEMQGCEVAIAFVVPFWSASFCIHSGKVHDP